LPYATDAAGNYNCLWHSSFKDALILQLSGNETTSAIGTLIFWELTKKQQIIRDNCFFQYIATAK